MNELEKALMSKENLDLDSYLDMTPTVQVRKDIEDIKQAASDLSEATKKLKAISDIIKN